LNACSLLEGKIIVGDFCSCISLEGNSEVDLFAMSLSVKDFEGSLKKLLGDLPNNRKHHLYLNYIHSN
jgi:hypothetical protein